MKIQSDLFTLRVLFPASPDDMTHSMDDCKLVQSRWKKREEENKKKRKTISKTHHIILNKKEFFSRF